MTAHSLKLTVATFAATLTLAATGFTAQAQTVNGPQAHVKVPFAFVVGSTHFAAGAYSVRLVNDHTLEIGDGATNAMIMVTPDSNTTAETGKVVFHRYGTQFFLESMYRAGQQTHLVCVTTREAKQAAKTATVQMAANEEQPATIEVAVLTQATR